LRTHRAGRFSPVGDQLQRAAVGEWLAVERIGDQRRSVVDVRRHFADSE
jgi:hypothetical protein